MTATIVILSFLLLIFIYTTYNVLRKNEKCEDIIKSYEKYMINLSNIIKASEAKIQIIDKKGSFSGDDEVGFFFKTLQTLQEQLNNFKVN